MDLSQITGYVGTIIYVILGLVALWGAFCVVMAWARVKQKRFVSEEMQDEFLEAVEGPLREGRFDDITEMVERDQRAMCQLVYLAVTNRELGHEKARQLIVDRFERDVLGDLEHRLAWVNTVIKTAPMIGLFGTVIGMMGAFAKLGGMEAVQADQLANDIMVALITTASGLAIAIPLVMAITSVNLRIRKMEDLVGAGLTRFYAVYREVVPSSKPAKMTRRAEPARTG